MIETGVRQRVKALNHFLDDVYSHQAIMHDRIVPAWVVLGSPGYQRACWGVSPAGSVRVHVSGLDVIRDDHGVWKVLEDNVRVPSGVSYLMENREIMARVLPELFDAVAIQPVDHYATLLLEALALRRATAGRRLPQRRPAHAGLGQLGLLRARPARPPDGHRAGRGR